MATIAYTRRELKDGNYVALASWVLEGTDDGAPLYVPNFLYTMWQVHGTFGGGTIAIQGSLERAVTTWIAAVTQTGTALSATANLLRRTEGAYTWVRPIATVGVTSCIVYCLAPADHMAYIPSA